MLRVEKAAERVLTSQRAGLKVLGSWCQTYSLKQNHLEAKVGVVAKKALLPTRPEELFLQEEASGAGGEGGLYDLKYSRKLQATLMQLQGR